MNIKITPAQLFGEVSAIASKSVAHRQLICAAFSDAPTKISCPEISKDIIATADCLKALGAEITYENSQFNIIPIVEIKENAHLNCGESGSTLRFMLPVVSALGVKTTFKMEGRLPKRPLSPMWEELISHGADLEKPTDDTIRVSGKLDNTPFSIRGDISSQFITGLLFSLCVLKEPTQIKATTPIESMPYINITNEVLKDFGINVTLKDNIFSIQGKLTTKGIYKSDGDWSNGAFWLCADKLSKKTVRCTGLSQNSPQGDKEILNILNELDKYESEIDGRNIPDLIPIVSVVASVSKGTTVIKNAQRLRIKESDRILSTFELIKNLGGKCEITDDGLIIEGVEKLKGGIIDSFNDHRIAMSAAIASIVCENEVVINGAEAVEKSYPAFWEDFKKLDGKYEILKEGEKL